MIQQEIRSVKDVNVPSTGPATTVKKAMVSVSLSLPANMRRWPNVGLLLAQRRRRWANSKPALAQRFLFAGSVQIRRQF